MKYPHMFTPIKIGNVMFKNRIFTAPATAHLLQAQEEYPTEPVIAYYSHKAKGGSACVTFGAQNMDRLAPVDSVHSDTNVYKTQYHRYWNQLTSAIHFYGAKASLELLAFEIHGYDDDGNLVTLSPSGAIGYDGTYMPQITEKEMSRIADEHAEAAEKAIMCGFDMILIHGGHGLFLSNFISPLFNTRDDEYGGSLENRAKFPIMILDRIRERVGRKILIEYRVSGSELAPEGGFAIEDCIKFVKMIEDKIDIAHISVGNMNIPLTEGIMHPTNFLKPGCNVEYANAVKQSGVKIPVLTLGAFQNPDLIEQVLAEGKADIVSMARGTIADPDLVNKAYEGKEDEIIPCIKCFHCLNYSRASEFGCSVNPAVGRELRLPFLIPPVGEKKKVIIIGGGPAGMEAAIVAKRRGHAVKIIEKSQRLGGKLVFSEHTDFKYDLEKFMKYLIHMVDKLGIEVKTNTEATPEMIEAENADVVLVAIGADAIIPLIPGVENKNVMTAEFAHANIHKVGKKVAVIGGGQVGCEIALHLAMSGKNVSLVEMGGLLAHDAMFLPREALIDRLKKNVQCYKHTRCVSIHDNRIICKKANGNELIIEADTVVLAVGMAARSDNAELFRGTAHTVCSIGDCVEPKNVRTALRTAFDAASQL
ncbi:MAG: NADH:flavin oxidoreductase, Old Yellow Enzyme family [Firmicutes bacterium]|nr:NADH:flavin oxidoreductase, Old Yellow Enzyme family [Bacillota bacterium]